MRFDQLRPCDVCQSPVAGNTRGGKALNFYRVVVEHMVLDVQAINERLELTAMLGGSETLAGAFAGHKEAAWPTTRCEHLICLPCWAQEGGRLELGKWEEVPR